MNILTSMNGIAVKPWPEKPLRLRRPLRRVKARYPNEIKCLEIILAHANGPSAVDFGRQLTEVIEYSGNSVRIVGQILFEKYNYRKRAHIASPLILHDLLMGQCPWESVWLRVVLKSIQWLPSGIIDEFNIPLPAPKEALAFKTCPQPLERILLYVQMQRHAFSNTVFDLLEEQNLAMQYLGNLMEERGLLRAYLITPMIRKEGQWTMEMIAVMLEYFGITEEAFLERLPLPDYLK